MTIRESLQGRLKRLRLRYNLGESIKESADPAVVADQRFAA